MTKADGLGNIGLSRWMGKWSLHDEPRSRLPSGLGGPMRSPPQQGRGEPRLGELPTWLTGRYLAIMPGLTSGAGGEGGDEERP